MNQMQKLTSKSGYFIECICITIAQGNFFTTNNNHAVPDLLNPFQWNDIRPMYSNKIRLWQFFQNGFHCHPRNHRRLSIPVNFQIIIQAFYEKYFTKGNLNEVI